MSGHPLQQLLEAEYEDEAEAWLKAGMPTKMKKKSPTDIPADRNRACIRTVSRKLFYPFNPSPKDVDVRDIAHHLSHICRFTGASLIFWSVGQHAMLAADIALAFSHSDPRLLSLEKTYATLHHDDSEAYCTDLSKPIKMHMKEYKAMESGVTKVIEEVLQIGSQYKAFVKDCDDQAYKVEASLLFDESKLDQELNREGSTFARLARLSFAEVRQMFLDYSDMLAAEIEEEKNKFFEEEKNKFFFYEPWLVTHNYTPVNDMNPTQLRIYKEFSP